MGFESRQYGREGDQQRSSTFGLPPIGRAVKYLLVINIAAYVLQLFLDATGGRGPGTGTMTEYLAVNLGAWWQPWRYVTFQFLHGDFWHIALNMLGLYMLGSPLEQMWGGRRFVYFYLSCGIFAGISYVLVAWMAALHPASPIIGASGGVFGILLAAAVYLPHMQIIFLFFPVPIRLAAVILFAGMILSVIGAEGGRAMSDVAHLGGAVMAAVWIWIVPRIRIAREGSVGRGNSGKWNRRMARRAAQQAEIDRILQKIHDKGLNSLTRGERKTLKDATKTQQEEERQMFRL